MPRVLFSKLQLILLVFLVPLISCNGQSKNEQASPPLAAAENKDAAIQIGEFIVEIFEDSRGGLWFGTMSKGAGYYDGSKFRYFTKNDGLVGNSVVSITEDADGNIWLGTHEGLSKFDGRKFTNYTTEDGLCHFRVSHVVIDSKGGFWIGTWGGVCRFDGTTFTKFDIPNPPTLKAYNPMTANWVTEVMEDSDGNIWLSRDGYAATMYDVETGEFTNYTKENGLPSNSVQSIVEDASGRIWFSSRVTEKDHPDVEQRHGEGGLSLLEEGHIRQFDQDGLHQNDVYSIYEDLDGTIWVGAIGVGIYAFKGSEHKVYPKTDRMDLTEGMALQGILRDSRGILWMGFSGGLFRLDGEDIINVTQKGPWY